MTKFRGPQPWKKVASQLVRSVVKTVADLGLLHSETKFSLASISFIPELLFRTNLNVIHTCFLIYVRELPCSPFDHVALRLEVRQCLTPCLCHGRFATWVLAQDCRVRGTPP